MTEDRQPGNEQGSAAEEAREGTGKVQPDALEDPVPQEEGDSHPKEAPETGEKGENGRDGAESPEEGEIPEEEEIGITLSDDELWDEDGDLEEIPLFEDEPGLGKDPADEQEGRKQDVSRGQAPPEEGAPSREVTGGEVPGSGGKEDEEAGETGPARPFGTLRDLLPWLLTALSAVLIVLGIAVLWAIWPSPGISQEGLPSPASTKTAAPGNTLKEVRLASGPGEESRDIESINLAPFLIPVQRAGELVFLKLHVELIVPDMQSKIDLLSRESTLRDTIYQALKGISIRPGKGNILLRYRRSILDRLNDQFKPYHIDDIRLSGYVLN